jgi:hypothetical protein
MIGRLGGQRRLNVRDEINATLSSKINTALATILDLKANLHHLTKKFSICRHYDDDLH